MTLAAVSETRQSVSLRGNELRFTEYSFTPPGNDRIRSIATCEITMVLSETEAEAQLASLRRQRETLDRAIADLTLYLELGRRLTGVPAHEAIGTVPSSASGDALPHDRDTRDHATRVQDAGGWTVTHAEAVPLANDVEPINVVGSKTGSKPSVAPEEDGKREVGDVPSAFSSSGKQSYPLSEPARNGLSETVLARRHGRALIEAAFDVLGEADRPLHAGEILAILTQRGFSLPGHDPIAALNTRLWKRSGPSGPLVRMGEAVYALADPGEAEPAPSRRS